MDLAGLIAANKRGRSYDKLEKDCGGEPTSGRIQQLATQTLKTWPTPAVMHGLARGLGVSAGRVVLATAESLGFRMDSAVPRLVEFLPASAMRMTDEQMSAVGELLRSFLDDPVVRRNADVVYELRKQRSSELRARWRERELDEGGSSDDQPSEAEKRLTARADAGPDVVGTDPGGDKPGRGPSSADLSRTVDTEPVTPIRRPMRRVQGEAASKRKIDPTEGGGDDGS